MNDVDESPEVLSSTYQLPNSAESWPLWNNFVLSVDVGVIDSYGLPADEAGLACETIGENDTNVFPGQWPGADGTVRPGVLHDAGTVLLVGPSILGELVTGRADLGAASKVEFVEGSDGAVSLAQLDLLVDGDVVVGSQVGSIEFSDVRIELDRPVLDLLPTASGGNYTIEAGDAGFWVSGVRVDDRSVGARIFLPLTSTLDFVYDASEQVWTMDAFTLAYRHWSGNDWEVEVAATSWQ